MTNKMNIQQAINDLYNSISVANMSDDNVLNNVIDIVNASDENIKKRVATVLLKITVSFGYPGAVQSLIDDGADASLCEDVKFKRSTYPIENRWKKYTMCKQMINNCLFKPAFGGDGVTTTPNELMKKIGI